MFQRLECDYQATTVAPVVTKDALDLFEWSEIDASRPQALTDRFQFAAEKGLLVYYTTPRQFRTSRLMIYLHLISRYEQSKMRFTQFPAVESALQPRPKYKKSEKEKPFTPWQRLHGDVM